MGSIKKSTFSTAQLTPADRFGVWRESISSIFDVSRASSSSDENFDAFLESYLIDDQFMLCRCATTAQLFERSPLRNAEDGLDYYLVQTHLTGSQDVRRGSKERTSGTGDLLVLDLAENHQAVTTDFHHLTLVIPRHMLAPLLRNPDSQEGRVLEGGSALTRLAVSHLQTLAQVVPSMNEEEATLLIEPTLRLMASALNGSAETIQNGAGAAAESVLTRAKLAIEQNLHRNDLNVDSLCGIMGLSRASLYRLFEPHGGVRAYVQERRLRHTVADLSSPFNDRRSIYDIAFNRGFTSEAHFSRAFKRRFGTSPRDFRKSRMHRSIGANAISMERIGDRNYEAWLAETLKS